MAKKINIGMIFGNVRERLNESISGLLSKNSVTGTGIEDDEFQLVNDEDEPGNKKYYGTDESGEKGFHKFEEVEEYEWNLQGRKGQPLPEVTGFVVDTDGTGEITYEYDYPFLISAYNANGETIPQEAPLFTEKEDTTKWKLSWDDIPGADGYYIYLPVTGWNNGIPYLLGYEKTYWLQNEVDFFVVDLLENFIEQIDISELPTENTTGGTGFPIKNNDLVKVIGDGIDINVSEDSEDSTTKIIHLTKQQADWEEDDTDSPNYVKGKPVLKDGREVQLRTDGGYVEWKYDDEANWTQLFKLPDDGKSVELQTSGGYVQWKQTGGSWANLFKIPADGDPGQNAFLYVAYASDDQGSGFSLIPSNSLKYRAEIQRITPLVPPVAGDFSGATWVKYIGDDGQGSGGGGGDDNPELHIDFEESGDEFTYNVPYKMKFTVQTSENSDASLSEALNSTLERYDRLTITATAAGLVSLYGEYID